MDFSEQMQSMRPHFEMMDHMTDLWIMLITVISVLFFLVLLGLFFVWREQKMARYARALHQDPQAQRDAKRFGDAEEE